MSNLMLMKRTVLILFIFLSYTFISCGSKSSVEEALIPADAIPFEYDFGLRRMILLNGTLNDSISVKYALETGAGAMVFSDIFAYDYEKQIKTSKINSKVCKPMTVQVGKWTQTYGDSTYASYLDKDNYMFKGIAEAFLPWQFFDKKIIEISFTHQYMRELPDLPVLSGYDSVKMEATHMFLKIPMVIYIQGKKIKELFTIDTGFNGTISLNKNIISQYKINLDDAKEGSAGTAGSSGYKIVSIDIDSIGSENHFVGNGHTADILIDERLNFPFSGLLGNKFFENFDIVFDLKNYDLYLKPVGIHYKENRKTGTNN